MELKKLFNDNNGKLHFAYEAPKFSLLENPDKGFTTLTGYAMKWNDLSVPRSDFGGAKVRLAPNSANFITPTFALENHNYDRTLARTDEGSLRITYDNIGAKVEIDVLHDVTYASDILANVKNNRIKGMSFAMLYDGVEFSETKENGFDVVTFSRFNSDEVTVTPKPAFSGTTIAVKQEAQKLLSDEKEYLDQYTKLRELEIWMAVNS